MRRALLLCESATFVPLPWNEKKNTEGEAFTANAKESTVLPTFALQQSLPRLPIPTLSKTTERYLRAVRPLITPDAFSHTTQTVDRFLKNEGPLLQKELQRTDQKNLHTSYVSADWFDRYLRDRTPLPIHYNPVLVVRNDIDKRDPVTRAAFWVHSSVKWLSEISDHTLQPEVFYFAGPKHYSRQPWFHRGIAFTPSLLRSPLMMTLSRFNAFPLDMSQYIRLFASTRIPYEGVDVIETYCTNFLQQRRKTDDENFYPTHITVVCRGHYFKVDVADKKGQPLPIGIIYARLQYIRQLALSPASFDVGLFTSMERNEWAATRTALSRDVINAASLKAVDQSLFVVSLDLDYSSTHDSPRAHADSTKWMLATNQNRWWDKSLSVSFTANGVASVTFEHAWGDGVAVLRYTQDVYNDTMSQSSTALPTETLGDRTGVEQLLWNLDDASRRVWELAKQRLDNDIRNTNFSFVYLDGIGKSLNVFRSTKIKFDPFVQVGIQLAWWRRYRSVVSTYESASTAAFRKGRTEAIRSATIESAAFVQQFDNPSLSSDEKVSLLRKATERHAQLSKEAKMGQGVDRHLFSLHCVSHRLAVNSPLFSDPSYATLGSNILSTSTVFSKALMSGGFGPVSAGYSVGYAGSDTDVGFNVSCWSANGPQYSAEEFAETLAQTLFEMTALLQREIKLN